MAIFAEVTKNECVNDRHVRDNVYNAVQCSTMTIRVYVKGAATLFGKITHPAPRFPCDS